MERSKNVQNYGSLIGMTVEEAKQIYRKIRVVKEDGVSLCVTEDFRMDRLNVATSGGIITELVGFS